MTSSVTTQTHIQGSELVNPQIYMICEWLVIVKGPVLLQDLHDKA